MILGKLPRMALTTVFLLMKKEAISANCLINVIEDVTLFSLKKEKRKREDVVRQLSEDASGSRLGDCHR